MPYNIELKDLEDFYEAMDKDPRQFLFIQASSSGRLVSKVYGIFEAYDRHKERAFQMEVGHAEHGVSGTTEWMLIRLADGHYPNEYHA